MVYPWGTSRRFNSYSDYFKTRFGGRVQKLSINAGFTCPNRDGKLSKGGCTYCDNQAFSPSYVSSGKTISEQIETGIAFHGKRYRKVKEFLAYFQSFSNTYAPLEKLKEIYNEALEYPGIVGIIVGTRPDCIDNEVLDYFSEIAKRKFLVIEYGIETVYNRTLASINRGHTFETTVKAIQETADRGILVGGHLIIGLP
ncbi:MAG TPA: TIGR01212 family radical SAM protein, partial [Bacteroidales bacterium]|nr:TIGR01212 family radical SAM protein [Bacteroidales bacterium]